MLIRLDYGLGIIPCHLGYLFQAFAVSDQTIETILHDPLLVWQVVEHENPEAYQKAVAIANRKHFLKRLWGKSYPAVEPSQLVFSEHDRRMLDRDKSWDGLNFIFRTLWPEAPSFFEHAAEIAKLEVGLGPALYHFGQDMAVFAKNMARVSEQELLAAFGKTDFSEAYMDKYWEREDSDAIPYLIENFLALKAFAAHTAQHSLGAILQFG